MKYAPSCPDPGNVGCASAEPVFDRLHLAQDEDRDADLIQAATEIEAICPACPHAAKDKAWAAITLGDYATAESIADDLLACGSDHRANGLDLKGGVTLAVSGPEAALPWFHQEYELDPESHGANCHLAEAFCRLERYEEALPFARRARITHPDEGRAVGLLCIALAETQAGDELLSVVNEISGTGWDALTETNVAKALWRVDGAERAALAWSKRVLKRQPENVDALCLASRASNHLGQHDSALRLLSRLRRVDPIHHGAFAALHMARTYAEHKSDWRKALETIVAGRLDFPQNDDVRQYQQYVADRLVGSLEEKVGESEQWRSRFEALSSEHASLRQAIAQMHAASEPGIPLLVATLEGEGQQIEFIESYPDNAHDLAKEIAAFAPRMTAISSSAWPTTAQPSDSKISKRCERRMHCSTESAGRLQDQWCPQLRWRCRSCLGRKRLSSESSFLRGNSPFTTLHEYRMFGTSTALDPQNPTKSKS